MEETRTDKTVRLARLVAYALMVLAACTLPIQIDLLSRQIIEWIWLVMTVWMGLGGLLSLIGTVSKRWTGEFVGLPLLFTAFLGFGVLQARVSGWTLAAAPSTALLWSLALLLYARWRDTLRYYRVAQEGARK